MLKVRLQRTGKRGQAYFRVIVVEHTKKPRGEFLELLGNYDPHMKEFKVDMDRINNWVSKGAQVSPTVNNLLVNYKYWDKPKMVSWKPKKSDKKPSSVEASAGKQGTSDQEKLSEPVPVEAKKESLTEPQSESAPV